jgi:glycosyltransferase involved in cell wall biosynthesis
MRKLSVQIVFRTPVGGLFRHVRDLARGLHEAGHRAGIICDSETGGELAAQQLRALAPYCALGVERLPVSRTPGLGDWAAARQIARLAGRNRPDIIHGHGAKGGLYARLAGRLLGVPSLYVPHGGSLHYSWTDPAGAVFLASEKMLRPLSGGLHFVCAFEKETFAAKIGLGRTPSRVIHNGLWPEEFTPVVPAPDASDVVFIGELRFLKGVDVLLRAVDLARRSRRITATIVGEGPDRSAFESLARDLDLAAQVNFAGALPARTALTRGRVFVMPSRAESLPYVVLEAAAAQMPLIASAVGGIGEVIPAEWLVPPDDADALAARMLGMLDSPRKAPLSREMTAHLDCRRMVREIVEFYAELS